MITPLEIENKDFGKSINGYNKNEVDEFMVGVCRDMERHIMEEENLKNRVKDLEKQLENFKAIETSLKGALIIAEETSQEVKKNANEKAKLIIHDAEIQAKRIIDDANGESIDVKHRTQDLKKEYTAFKIRFRSMVNAELETIDKMGIDD